METTKIKIIDFCHSRKVEASFIQILQESELIHITVEQNVEYVDEDELRNLERFAALYYDLDVNLQGIEVAHHLLQKVEHLQEELRLLQAKMRSLEQG
ncbi:chaperone-modulator protein CbpM [Sphingobacterium spiritivorum]|uniref:Chaperone-modulator protein CbpM n=1 Tax=Sphingobacterium spiritivorum TaxID=258 RepID=A0A380CCC8_SPHSI|nr:chaperone modulator CbpM [Sphingobacterium spiritivorum]SUJ17599.1 chaperone-modulator protein CbpM [Sphingobacterium spiritivorum]